MTTALRSSLLLAFGLTPLLAVAQPQPLQPGLWELSSSDMQVDGQALPDVNRLLEGLPAAQRQMLEGAMAEQGVQFGGQGVQVCMTQAQIDSGQIPLQDPKTGCSQRITERSADRWAFTFSCPQGQGQGETQFLSDREFLTRLNGTFTHNGQAREGSLQTRARWVAADCGNLKKS